MSLWSSWIKAPRRKSTAGSQGSGCPGLVRRGKVEVSVKGSVGHREKREVVRNGENGNQLFWACSDNMLLFWVFWFLFYFLSQLCEADTIIPFYNLGDVSSSPQGTVNTAQIQSCGTPGPRLQHRIRRHTEAWEGGRGQSLASSSRKTRNNHGWVMSRWTIWGTAIFSQVRTKNTVNSWVSA